MEIYMHEDYRVFLKSQIEKSKKIRGFQSRMAEAAACHASHLSAVLKETAHLTPDQAAGVSSFLQLDEDQAEYLLTMVMLERSGTSSLKDILQKKLKKLRVNFDDIAARLSPDAVDAKEMALYYESWTIQAVHLLLMIKEFQDSSKIAERLGLSLTMVLGIINRLQELGLVEEKDGVYLITHKNIHLPPNSQHVWNFHNQWRQRAMTTIHAAKPEDLHFTSCCTLPKGSFMKVKDACYKMIEELSKEADKSDEDAEPFTLMLDFMPL